MPVSSSIGYDSGFLGLPPRVNLRMLDDSMGSYPVKTRTGDPDYLGTFPSRFDDTTVLIFSGVGGSSTNQDVVYPTLLPRNYIFAGSSVENQQGFSLGVAQPNITSSISRDRDVVSGISDRMFHFSTNMEPSQSLKPFNESRVYLGTGDFYATGTSPSILPDFSAGLRSKTQLVINLDPVEETSIFFSTGTAPNASGIKRGVNSGLAYFNWQDKRWEIIGDLTTGSNVDYLNRYNDVRTGSYVAFPNGMAGQSFGMNPVSSTALASGAPSNFAGFPLSSKFNATGSQLLKMSDYINHPFLLEKVVFEWSGSVNTLSIGAAGESKFPQVSSFFILNQFETPVSRSLHTGKQIYIETEGTDTYVVSHNGPFFVDREKDIVTYGTMVKSTVAQSTLSKFQQRDLVLEGTDTGITGSFRLEMPVVTPGIYPNALFGTFTRDRLYTGPYDITFFGNPDGGRNLFGESSGRSFIASSVGSPISGSAFRFNWTAQNTQLIQPYEKLTRISPYVIMPSDSLVFGFANQPTPQLNVTSGDTTEVGMASKLRNVMAPGPSKVTMFGTLLRNSRPIGFETNQPLTSDAIHEAICGDDLVVDQFQVEPFYTYRGVYIDDVYGGKFFKNTRGIVGRCTEGTQGTTGSLLKGVRLNDVTERYYDSLMPALSAYFSEKEVGGTVFKTNQSGYTDLPFNAYFFSGAMEGEDPGSLTYWNATRALPFPYASNPLRVVKDNAGLIVSASADSLSYEAILDYDQVKEALFQVGLQSRKFTVQTQNSRTPAGTGNEQVISDKKFAGAIAFRYGIANIAAMNSSAVFRYDKFGQFRDLLEQRPTTRFYDSSDSATTVLEAAVEIKFVNSDYDLIEPIDTISQNLSPYATSSLPYFDGMAVDRNDDPYKQTTIVISELEDL